MIERSKVEHDAMEYLAYLLALISERESKLKMSLEQYRNADQRGEDPVLRLGDEVVRFEQLAIMFKVLHFENKTPDERSMRRPWENQEEIRRIILAKRKVLTELGINFKSAPTLEAWLCAESKVEG